MVTTYTPTGRIQKWWKDIQKVLDVQKNDQKVIESNWYRIATTSRQRWHSTYSGGLEKKLGAERSRSMNHQLMYIIYNVAVKPLVLFFAYTCALHQ